MHVPKSSSAIRIAPGCFCLSFMTASGVMRSLLKEDMKQMVWARGSFNSSSPGMISLKICALLRKSFKMVTKVPSAWKRKRKSQPCEPCNKFTLKS